MSRREFLAVSPHTSAGLAQPQRAIAIFAVLSAMSLVVLDAGMVNVALPSMAQSLNVTPAMSILAVTAYQTGLIMGLLPSAALGQRFGYRRVFVGGICIFTTASILCAASSSLPWLIAARTLQGLGGSAVMALGVALLRFTVPPDRVGAAIGWNALTVALSSAASPAIGALLLSSASWHWLFLVNIPLGAATLVSSRVLPLTAATAQIIDSTSVLLNGLAFVLLVLAAELIVSCTLASALFLALSAYAFVALVRREKPKAAPMIPLDLLHIPSFRLSVIASICCFAGQTAGLVALPFYLQHALGQSALMIGLYMTTWPLAVAVTALAAGYLSDRIHTAWLSSAGGICLAVGLAGSAVWPLQGDPRPLIPFTILCGIGFGLFQTPNNRNLFLSAPLARSGAAGGMQGTARLSGQLAAAVLLTLLFSVASMQLAPRFGLGIGAALALAAAITSLLRASMIAPNHPIERHRT